MALFIGHVMCSDWSTSFSRQQAAGKIEVMCISLILSSYCQDTDPVF